MRTFIIAAVVLAAFTNPALAIPGDDAALVESWYRRYFGRSADPIGIHDHIRALRRCTPPLTVEASILSSDEYYRRHGATPPGFVTGLFYDILGRPPAQDEVRFWSDQVIRRGRSRVAVQFLQDQTRDLRPAPDVRGAPDPRGAPDFRGAPIPPPLRAWD